MDSKEVSKCYVRTACGMHNLVTNLYEDLHKDNGEAIVDEIVVRKKCNEFIADMKTELSFIRDAIREYREMRYQSIKRSSDD